MTRPRHPLLRALQAIGVTTLGIQIEEDLSTGGVSRGALLLVNPSYPLTWWLTSGEPHEVTREEFAEVLARQAGRVVHCRPPELVAEARDLWGHAQLEQAIRRSARPSPRTERRQPAPSLDGADHDGLSGAVEQLLNSLDVAPAGELIEPSAADLLAGVPPGPGRRVRRLPREEPRPCIRCQQEFQPRRFSVKTCDGCLRCEKPWPCGVCGKDFHRQHVGIINCESCRPIAKTGRNMRQCVMCGEKFRRARFGSRCCPKCKAELRD